MLKGSLAVAVGSVLFGSIGLFVHGLRDLPFPALVAYRYGLAALAFGLAVALAPGIRHASRFHARDAWLVAALGALLVAIEVLFFRAILVIGMGLATILLATAPLYVALAGPVVTGERPDGRAWAGIALGFMGVVLIVGPGALEGDAGNALGVLAGAGSGIAWGGWLLVSRVAGSRGVSGEAQAGGGMIVATLLTAPVALAFAPVVPDARGFGLLILLGAGAGGVGILLFTRGLHHVSAARAAVIAYLEPLTAVVLGALVLAEPFGAWQAAGSAAVLAGTALVTVRGRAATAAPIPP